MSIEAMVWVRKHAPTKNSAEMCILYALADRANDDGTGCWPYYETLADEARVSLPTVKRHIKNLEERGLILRGNQASVASYPKYRKPVVWNLNMKLRREVKKRGEKVGGHIDTTEDRGINQDEVGYQYEQSEVSTVTDCGVTGDTDNPPITILQSSSEPTPLTPQGGNTGGELDIIEQSPAIVETTPQKNTRGERLPEEWFPTQRSIELVRNEHPTITDDFLRREHNKFTDHFIASSNANARKRDWDAAWRNWMRTAMERTQPRGRNTGKPTMQEINTWTLPIQDPNNLTQEPDSDYRPF